jgi:2-polyprenyl-3-methyl-5-hydroxy-6-metoxy-1,4-benzoquinol methylase
MNRVSPLESWPRSWLESYERDRQEIFGEIIHHGYTYAYQNRLKHTLDMVRKVAPPGSRILDVAAAQGTFALSLAEAGYDVTWNDLREELAGYVELKHSHGMIRYQPGNILDLSAARASYDLVLINEIIEHVAHPDKFLHHVASLVRPGGFIVMTTPNGEYFRNKLPKFSNCSDPSAFESVQFKPDSDGHIFLIHHDELYMFAEQSGLTVQEVRFFTTPLTGGYMKLEYLLHVLPRGFVDSLDTACQKLPNILKRKLYGHIGAIFCKPDHSARYGAGS